MDEKTFRSLGRVEAINELYHGTPFKPFTHNWFESPQRGFVFSSSRAFLEGVDFDLVYFPLKHLGYKCTTAVTGELYAEMAAPKLLTIVLGVSAKLDYSHIKELWQGIVTAAKEHGYKDVNLDLVPSRNGLCISMTATGERSGENASRRPIAQSKDLICLSGNVGGAYLGMQILEKEKKQFGQQGENSAQPDLEQYKMMVGSYLKPEINPSIISSLEESDIIPSYGYVVKRGLSDALRQLVRDSGLGAKVYAEKIPFEGNSVSLSKEFNVDPISVAMNGGEDYKLLYVIPILQAEKFRKDFQTFEIIGHLARPEVGAVLVTPEGVELPVTAQGWPDQE